MKDNDGISILSILDFLTDLKVRKKHLFANLSSPQCWKLFRNHKGWVLLHGIFHVVRSNNHNIEGKSSYLPYEKEIRGEVDVAGVVVDLNRVLCYLGP